MSVQFLLTNTAGKKHQVLEHENGNKHSLFTPVP